MIGTTTTNIGRNKGDRFFMSNGSLVFSLETTDRKKGRALAEYKKFCEEITPRTAINNFIEVWLKHPLVDRKIDDR